MPRSPSMKPSAILMRRWRAKNPEVARAKDRQWYHDHRARSQELARNAYVKAKTKPRFRPARRNSRFLYKYGITLATYEQMREAQGGRCAICGNIETVDKNGRIRPLVVDHDHATGQVRALLCQYCNAALGMLRDRPELADRAAAYLRQHQRGA